MASRKMFLEIGERFRYMNVFRFRLLSVVKLLNSNLTSNNDIDKTMSVDIFLVIFGDTL